MLPSLAPAFRVSSMLVAGAAFAAEMAKPTAALSTAIINRFLIMTFFSERNLPPTKHWREMQLSICDRPRSAVAR